jgi:hypothetical protein
MTKYKRKTIKRKNKRNKRRSSRKMKGGQLPEFKGPLNETINSLLEGAEFVESGKNTTKDIYDSVLSKEEKGSFERYQEKSILINGFVREGFDYFTTEAVNRDSDNPKEEFMEETEMDSEYKLDDIKNIDNVFLHKSPRFNKKTVLFRGTDDFYGEGKGYTSTTKNFQNLFTMMERGDNFLSVQNKCCINMLIVEQGIPYLDLEIDGSHWLYQQEVLLPRNLNFAVVGESSYDYKGIEYKVYIYHVTLIDGEYMIADNDYEQFDIHNDSLFIKEKDLLFLLKTQTKELPKMIKYMYDDEDVMQDLYTIREELTYFLTRNVRFLCTKTKYLYICEKFLSSLKMLIKDVTDKNIVKPEYVANIEEINKKIDDRINELKMGTLLFTKNNFIEAK